MMPDSGRSIPPVIFRERAFQRHNALGYPRDIGADEALATASLF